MQKHAAGENWAEHADADGDDELVEDGRDQEGNEGCHGASSLRNMHKVVVNVTEHPLVDGPMRFFKVGKRETPNER